MTLSATKDILGGPKQDRDYIVTLATNLGWKTVELDGVAKPDLLLLRDSLIAVFIRSRWLTAARRRSMSQFTLAGTRARLWGREDGTEILRVLGGD